MLSYVQSGLLILLALVVSIVMVAVLNRVWPIHHRKLINDVTGWQLGILGTTYGVILGFMLYTVWTDFHVAEVNTTLEATSLLNVSRVAMELPSPDREAMHGMAMRYADAVLQEEWPAMRRQEENHASEAVAGEMWRLIAETKIDGEAAGNSVDHLTSSLSDLTERRNLREEELSVRLPAMLWILLMAGAGATVGSSCVLGNDNRWLHYFQVLALTFVVAVAIASIADLARPFEGSVAVSPAAFERVQKTMQRDASR
jgi:Protein of unknown function (DUF4239)